MDPVGWGVGPPWIGLGLSCPTGAQSDWDLGNLGAMVYILDSLSCFLTHQSTQLPGPKVSLQNTALYWIINVSNFVC